MRAFYRALASVTAFAIGACVLNAGEILLEAEAFQDSGGWTLDQQFMDQMGSPYLLAHGLGKPVADASTEIEIKEPGSYRVWVRTKDWVAKWKASGAPGRFSVLLDGTPLKTVFGTEGALWHWQDGGSFETKGGKLKIALRDLSGFDGRCDALLLSSTPGFLPPEDLSALKALRKRLAGFPEKPEDAGSYDLVVVGGGVAGCCAAVSAARFGLKVALIHDRPALGGNNSSEVRVHVCGGLEQEPYPKLGGLVKELKPAKQGNAKGPENYEDAKKLELVESEPNLRLFLNMRANKAETKGARIVSLTAVDTRSGRESSFSGAFFADCSGDGSLGFLAGAEFREGRESKAETGESLAPSKADNLTMGSSAMWRGVDLDSEESFPECPWAVKFNEGNCLKKSVGDWNWETGIGLDPIKDGEEIRDYAIRAVYGNWDFLKNRSAEKARFAKKRLDWVSFIAGRRESRRLLGDLVLSQNDIDSRKAYPDACVTATWPIDLHSPNPKNAKDFPEGAFIAVSKQTKIQPYPIPYRCLYSKNVSNLFMAGRDISVTHVALGAVRVMGTTGMMGEVVGMAAYLCVKKGEAPRGVYEKSLEDLKGLMEKGVPPSKTARAQAK